MVKYNYKLEGYFSTDGSASVYDLWSLDLSGITGTNLMIEVTTTLYDTRVADGSVRYSQTAVYKNTSATVAILTNQTESQYVYTQGDSRPKQIVWTQGTSTLSQQAEILGVLDFRNIYYLSKVTVIAF